MDSDYEKVKLFIEENGDEYYLCEIEDILGINEETLLEIFKELKKDNIITENHYFETGCLNNKICADCFEPMEHEDTKLEEDSKGDIQYKHIYRCHKCLKKEYY
ncbi:MAG: hypothetical protein HZC47_07260 [Methanobacterium sp.]|uniref:hypothetical protein n=1 Tax=Methanobacterium sp. TaxID=2164 RepID=UPI003D654331|nr:hypothetical protein [Methanobacterium sp.]